MKRMISVIGLMPAQSQMLANEFKGVDIRFWDKGDALSKLKSLATKSERVFMRTQLTNHNTSDILRNSKAKVTLVHGGISMLRKHIQEYLNG